VISYYAPADMVWGYSIPSNPLIMDSRKVMGDYLGGTYNQVPKNFEASSPLLAATKNSVPTLLIHGEMDVLVAYEHTRRLNIKLNELGVKHFVLTLPWATHGCDFTLNGPSGQLATYTVTRFLNQITK
jgi:acetyl esterase/lipase